MADNNRIPKEFNERLLFFKDLVKDQFSFLQKFNFSLDKEESGQKENFKEYFFEFTYKNVDTVIKINFSTDIINGVKKTFPKQKDEELPVVDSQMWCAIWDKNAFMSVNSYIDEKFPDISKDHFIIKFGADLKPELTRVTKNYSEFFKANLISVLEKKVIFKCYTDRFYDKIFQEIRYKP
jgi:hypothetical protein